MFEKLFKRGSKENTKEGRHIIHIPSKFMEIENNLILEQLTLYFEENHLDNINEFNFDLEFEDNHIITDIEFYEALKPTEMNIDILLRHLQAIDRFSKLSSSGNVLSFENNILGENIALLLSLISPINIRDYINFMRYKDFSKEPVNLERDIEEILATHGICEETVQLLIERFIYISGDSGKKQVERNFSKITNFLGNGDIKIGEEIFVKRIFERAIEEDKQIQELMDSDVFYPKDFMSVNEDLIITKMFKELSLLDIEEIYDQYDK